MNGPSLSPVTGVERLDQLDVLRGFALFGILLVNFEYFLQPLQTVVLGSELSVASADGAVGFAVKSLAEGKFYALFSTLFGAGFALMLDRARERAAPFWPVYLRRLLVLLAIGAVHMFLVWSGDILMIYAVVALVMVLLFRNTPVQRLWKWALVFLLGTLVLFGLWSLSLVFTPPDQVAEMRAESEAMVAQIEAAVAEAMRAQSSGSWADMNDQRVRDFLFQAANVGFWIWPILGYFLLGRWLIASGRLAAPDQHAAFYRKTKALGIGIGLPLSVAAAWLTWDQNYMVMTPELMGGMFAAGIGAPLLALGYLSLVVTNRGALAWLAPAGRMALTNYLAQSLAWTWLIYGHGAGLGSVLPYWATPVLVTAFFALQIAFSHWWLARFRFGPAEWLWRSLTYLRVQPMRRGAEHAV